MEDLDPAIAEIRLGISKWMRLNHGKAMTIFHSFDKANKGELDVAQFAEGCKRMKLPVKTKDVELLILFYDKSGRGTINYKDFALNHRYWHLDKLYQDNKSADPILRAHVEGHALADRPEGSAETHVVSGGDDESGEDAAGGGDDGGSDDGGGAGGQDGEDGMGEDEGGGKVYTTTMAMLALAVKNHFLPN